MAEAEDVLTDAARHATIWVQALWRRHRGAPPAPGLVELAEAAQRLDLLLHALFGRRFALYTAQPPAPPRLLARLLRRHAGPFTGEAVPATDGISLWLPARLDLGQRAASLERYRLLALQQAMRAERGSAAAMQTLADPGQRSFYLLLEAWAADADLLHRLPGLAAPLGQLRRDALARRPPLSACTRPYRVLEGFLRELLCSECGRPLPGLDLPATPADSLQQARRLAGQLLPAAGSAAALQLRDCWTGDLLAPAALDEETLDSAAEPDATERPSRSARLFRRPDVRRPGLDEDEEQEPGAWMVQTTQPQEHAEDPMGLQRPADRDATTPAESFADSLAELEQARLVATPAPAKEVLLGDDPPATTARLRSEAKTRAGIAYPEWDYRLQRYRDPGAWVRLCPAEAGSQEWVERTLEIHRPLLEAVRRPFERLRARRLLLRRQLDGDDIDLEAYADALARSRAGLDMPQTLYQQQRISRRDLAILLLIDVSGSTDGWLCQQRRIIDVEREALLLVCLALESLGEPYCVQAFSGEGPQAVTLRPLKAFAERYGVTVARRIAALEPERYTRAGAAIRHASACLMGQPATHRLLLLLSDGKPNDADEYEGRYGVEDMRQAVNEAKRQGIQPFCLTIDRQAASYLPAVFGSRRYALLSEPKRLPGVLLEWIGRLLAN